MQNQRALLFLILAVALGVGAAFTAQRWLEQQRQEPTAQKAATQPVSVMVDPVVGVAGFIVPGAHVDVLVTLQRIDSDGKPNTKVILQDVQVLAIDQKLEEAKQGEPQLVSVVTLETDPTDAEKLTYAF